MQIKKPFYKINFEDIDIASEFFDHNQKHLSEFIMATIAYYSGKNVEIKSKLVEKYFKTYKKTMDSVILAKESGIKGAILKAESQTDKPTTLEGVLEDSVSETLPTNNKPLNINNKQETVKDKKEVFENFRISYLGNVRGLDTEFSDFKKHKDWNECLELLLPALQKQIQIRNNKIKQGGFVPNWKHLKTWINQRCWEEEIKIEESNNSTADNRLKVNDYPPGYVHKTNMQRMEEYLLETQEANKLKELKMQNNEPQY